MVLGANPGSLCYFALVPFRWIDKKATFTNEIIKIIFNL